MYLFSRFVILSMVLNLWILQNFEKCLYVCLFPICSTIYRFTGTKLGTEVGEGHEIKYEGMNCPKLETRQYNVLSRVCTFAAVAQGLFSRSFLSIA